MVDAQKIIEDIIKGAQSSEGFLRGGKVGVELQIIGEETKLASTNSTLHRAREEGIKAACEQYKVAAIPLIGAAAGLASKALPAIGSLAKKLIPGAGKAMKSPLGQQAAGGAAMTAGAMGAQNLMAPTPPPLPQ